MADRRMWRAQMAAFAPTNTVVAYDRRGFGETTYEAEPHVRVGDLEAVLAATTKGRVTLIGCSQGGRVAVDYALTHPAGVAALMLVAPAITGAPEPNSYPPRIQKLLDETEAAENAGDLDRLNTLEAHTWLDGPQEREGRVTGAARELFLDMNARALRAASAGDETSNTNAYARFAELKLPIRFVSGKLDFPHINERSAHLSRAAPDAGLERFSIERNRRDSLVAG